MSIFLLVPFMVVYIDTWVAPILPQMFAYLSLIFIYFFHFVIVIFVAVKPFICNERWCDLLPRWLVLAPEKKTATHTHTAYIQTHLYLQSQNQMYLEGAPMATMWWRAFNYDFHKFSTKSNAIRTNTSLRREPPSS